MNALDFDDGFEVDGRGMGHPGATIIAAALSFVGEGQISGAEFLSAIIAGYEVNNRLIRSIQPSIERFHQVYGVCQHQTIGAAIACAKLARLDASAMENVLGFAGTFATLPSLHKYNWDRRPLITLKDFNAPAAEAAVRAVQLHQAGMIGAKDVLDGETGLWRMLGSDQFAPEILVGDLGQSWSLFQNAIKPYPTCRWMHAALEAFETVVAQNELVGRIDGVTVLTSAGMARNFMDRRPATMVDAQFSFPFAIAALVLGITPAERWYRPETIANEAVWALADKVHGEVDPEVDALMREVRRPVGRAVVVSGGRSYASGMVAYPRGGVERPLMESEIVGKFLNNARPRLGWAAEDLLHTIQNLQAFSSVGQIFGNGLGSPPNG
jgi:2-methylcitrate dehydratase PrpD